MTTKQHLTHLETTGLLRLAQTQPEVEYLFRHALVQDAAYGSLLIADRKQLHEQVAETLERLYPNRLDELAALLGHHFVAAGENEKAITYLLQAGDYARGYAHQEAVNLYQQALELLKEENDNERAARTLMKLGLTHHNAFAFEQARQAYEEGFILWQRTEEGSPAALPLVPHPLRLAWIEPKTLDPGLSNYTPDSAIITQLFSGLVSESSEMEVVPEVAWRWEVLEAGRKYIFHLREDTRWSDGVPLTAVDFEYAWKRVLDPATKSSNAYLLYDIKGAQAFHQGQISNPDHIKAYALDDVTLVVELEDPTSYFLHLLTQSGAFPVPRHSVEAHGETWTAIEKIVTNGPFSVETWNRSELMVLSRNQDYQGQVRGNVQKVALAFRQGDTDLSTRLLAAYELNNLDVVGLEPQKIALGRTRQQYAAEYMSSPILRTTYLGFNIDHPPFDNAQVRRAFALALNLDKSVDFGVFFPANGGFVPPGMPGHLPGLQLPFQPDQARHLLAEAGYPEGQAFPMVEGFTGQGGWETIGQNLQDQWRENLGIEIKWTIMEPSAFFDMLHTESPSLFIAGWVADYPDPDTFLRANPIRHITRWQNEVYDQLVEEARRVADQKRRMALYRQAEKILVEDAAIVPLAYSRDEWLKKPWVKKYPISATSWWLWKDVIIEPH